MTTSEQTKPGSSWQIFCTAAGARTDADLAAALAHTAERLRADLRAHGLRPGEIHMGEWVDAEPRGCGPVSYRRLWTTSEALA